MRRCGPRLVPYLTIAVLAAALLVVSGDVGSAQVGTGRLSLKAFDAFTGLEIHGICSTITAAGEPVSLGPFGELPVGTYDVEVTDCDGLYIPQRFTAVDIVPFEPQPITRLESTHLEAQLQLGTGAVVTGQVVDSFSAYPIEGVAAELIDTGTGDVIRRFCTDESGRYRHYVEPGIPVQMRFSDDSICSGYRDAYRRQWYPLAAGHTDAETLIPEEGKYALANAILHVDGGFVGRIVDPTGQIPGAGLSVYAIQGLRREYVPTRGDGSFTLPFRGTEINIEVKGIGVLADPEDPSKPASWSVSPGEVVSLGTFSLDLDRAVAGRVVDRSQRPVAGAVVHFFAEGEHGVRSTIQAITDAMGWYKTSEAIDGRYTAVVTFNDVNDEQNPAIDINGKWLGDTADRISATYLDFDGSSRGFVDFEVNRGETITEPFLGIQAAVPVYLTTDVERDGATHREPLEVEATIHSPSRLSLGTFYAPVPSQPGFTTTPLAATVIYDPVPGATALEVSFTFEPSQLDRPFGDIQVVWNSRLLRPCSVFAPPCEEDRSTSSRGDLVISALVPSGGEASFVWGPSFLDTGVSIFLNDIEWLADEGVTKGCSPPVNDLFCPKDQVTRGQMAAFLARFLGLTDRGDAGFTDDDGSVFEADIEKLAAAGITRGCNPPTNDMFCPNEPVTREQMAAFLTRALNLPAASGIDFSDDDGSIFEDSIERLAAAGITRGCNPPTNDQFCPTATVTREQMAAFLHRAGSLRP